MGTERESLRVVGTALPSGSPEPTHRRGAREVTPADLVRMLVHRWTTVAATTVVALVAAAAWVVATAPTYEATVILQLPERTPPAVAGIDDLPATADPTVANGEIEVLRSRTLLGQVVDKLRLAVEASPRSFPVFGAAMARRVPRQEPAAAPLGLDGWAWGGERIRVTRLDVPPSLVGRELRVTALQDAAFRLAGPDGTDLGEGRVGVPFVASVGGRPLTLQLAELVARPGTSFTAQVRSRDDVIDDLQKALRVEEKVKRSGVISVSLEGADPERLAQTLDALAAAYAQHQIARRTAELSRQLDFLETQLPTLKKGVVQAEQALNEFQVRRGAVNVSQETQSLLERIVGIERGLSDLRSREAELRLQFNDSHPELPTIRGRMKLLEDQRAAIDRRMRDLPLREAEAARLSRNVEVASGLYFHLQAKAQEIRIARAGVSGAVSLIDIARVPVDPVRPIPAIVLAVGLLLGLGAGVALALGHRVLSEGEEDPEEIEAAVGVPVFATIVRSSAERTLERAAGGRRRSRPALAEASREDPAVEALRAVRTAVQPALAAARRNVIVIGAPSPRVGKTFVAVNLAQLYAAEGKRVLLVDADLRRGRVHQFFGLHRGTGLAEVLRGEHPLEEAVRPTRIAGVDLLTTGSLPKDPSELLGGAALGKTIELARQRYDLVVVDTPPVLAVTDAALVAPLAGATLFVLRAGEHPIREINLALKVLARSGSSITGAVLNDARSVGGRYGYGRYRRYEYRSQRG
ncbi:polysaccharide biosynthesis tyrosine autokinase [Anaeromyxobacter oryzae]|uniref:Tyrosine kinase BceF n=1 Tax=Anaeromyxobacter oryzae TaxID=2918170 RepID=A0ABM7X156_9BACT|nr:polysaccharide biosynthesis tyrosine autokinase [Anaeromyxobacter oryzae]BDG05528.1 tyrosine kinase BceF [Anaeromyxobacter oryzae]